MVLLSTAEKIEIVELFRNFSAEETSRIFNNNHPDRQPPLHPQTVNKIWRKFLSRGSVERKKSNRNAPITNNPEFTERIIGLFEENPHLSIRGAARESRISRSSVHKILKKKSFFPYKPQIHQKLLGGDPRARVSFCRRYLHEVDEDDDFKRIVLWTDETLFKMNGCPNKQNSR